MDGLTHDGHIIEQSINDAECFAQLFDRHFATIHRYVARRLGVDLADELAAETFARAFRQRSRFDTTRSDSAPWLFGIASNLIKSHARGEARKLRAYARSGVDPVQDFTTAADNRASAGAQSRELMRAVAGVALRDREVLLLHAWADLSLAEIAEALEIPEGTVRSRLHRARCKIGASISAPGGLELEPVVASEEVVG